MGLFLYISLITKNKIIFSVTHCINFCNRDKIICRFVKNNNRLHFDNQHCIRLIFSK